MGSKSKYFKRNPISLFKQQINLKALFPESTCHIRTKDTLLWHGKIQPTPLSQVYVVSMSFQLWHPPSVWVTGNELQKLDDPNFPHKFSIETEKKKVRICLYHYREFNSFKFLAKTIIPWAVEWLYFYEIWLSTGEWLGGGVHPPEGKEKKELGEQNERRNTTKNNTNNSW